jgi:hypothetical protein
MAGVTAMGVISACTLLDRGVARFHGDEHVHVLTKPFRRDKLVELLRNVADPL